MITKQQKYRILFSGDNLLKLLESAEKLAYPIRYEAEVALASGMVQMIEKEEQNGH